MIHYLCPLCRAPIAPAAPTWRCAAGHAFDIAREGYVNLLPVQHKRSRAPGDNPAMVRARRDFLAAGHYAPLRDALVECVRQLGARRLLDLGCGEGWYTGALAAAVDEACGIDIAKDAVRLAAKTQPGIVWLVGSAALLPLADGTVDVATSLFGPLPGAELARVLAGGGHLLVTTPAAEHLGSLRAALFDAVRPHAPEKFLAALVPAFTPVSRRTVRFPLALGHDALGQLLAMTPYAWRATPVRRARLEAAAAFDTVAAFEVFVLCKAPG